MDGIRVHYKMAGSGAATPIVFVRGWTCDMTSWKIRFSSIRIALPEEAGWTVDARTSFGRIRADVPITVSGSLSTEAVQGKIGDGACPLTLSNSNGSIEILKEEKKK